VLLEAASRCESVHVDGYDLGASRFIPRRRHLKSAQSAGDTSSHPNLERFRRSLFRCSVATLGLPDTWFGYGLDGWRRTVPVSHQKRRERNTKNAIKPERKRTEINEPNRYPIAHNGLVAGS
jgi:hypothetical protein